MAYRFASSFGRVGSRLGAVMIVALLALPLSIATADSASANPFSKLEGWWGGSGTFTPVRGEPEKVRCRVTYNVKGSDVSQSINCAATDYSFVAKSNFTYGNGRIKGSWTESTYDAKGTVSGRASDSSVEADLRSDKFTGKMRISIADNRHTIAITQLDPRTGKYARVANVTLGR